MGLMLLGRVAVGLLGFLGSVRYGFGIYAWHVANRLEKPKYTVIRQLGRGVEVRKYEAYNVAEITFKRPGTMKVVSLG